MHHSCLFVPRPKPYILQERSLCTDGANSILSFVSCSQFLVSVIFILSFGHINFMTSGPKKLHIQQKPTAKIMNSTEVQNLGTSVVSKSHKRAIDTDFQLQAFSPTALLQAMVQSTIHLKVDVCAMITDFRTNSIQYIIVANGVSSKPLHVISTLAVSQQPGYPGR